MGIDIYAEWRGQSEQERRMQVNSWLVVTEGGRGYLREAYNGEPYATKHLFAEAFKKGKAHIKAAVLQERLPHTLALAEERERKLYQSSDKEIEEVKQSYRDFVALCKRKERETGEPVLVVASY